jgi:hypothetical protein
LTGNILGEYFLSYFLVFYWWIDSVYNKIWHVGESKKEKEGLKEEYNGKITSITKKVLVV